MSPLPFWHRVHLEGAVSPPSWWVPHSLTTHALSFIFFLIPPSSELLKETLVCPFFSYHRWAYSSLFFLVRILHSPSLLRSLLQAFFVISDTLCSITNATEEAERVGMRASNPQLPGRDGGRDHQQNTEETTLTKGIRQQMDLAIVLNHSEAKQQGSTSIYSRWWKVGMPVGERVYVTFHFCVSCKLI